MTVARLTSKIPYALGLNSVVNAIRKNGYKKSVGGDYIHYGVDETGANTIKGACAIGQAGLNLGIEPAFLREWLNSGSEDEHRDFIYRFGNYRCPVKNCVTLSLLYGNGIDAPLGDMLVHLNDVHRWSLNRISDWMDKEVLNNG